MSWRQPTLHALLAAVVAASPAAAQFPPRDSLGPGDHQRWVTAGGLRREYLVHVPTTYHGTSSAPVVLMFHGSGGSIDWDLRATGWVAKSEREGFVAVFPNGFPDDQGYRVWNDGRFRENRGAADDVTFVRALLEDLDRQLRIDRSRVFVTGFSNGAGLAFRLATELPDRIAAIAPVAGRMRVQPTMLRRPVPMLYIIGTADVTFSGYADSTGRDVALRSPARQSVARWSQLLECPGETRDSTEDERVRSVSYGPCRKGSEVVLYTIDGWEHYWPGGRAPGFELWAENLIWDFFRKHPLH